MSKRKIRQVAAVMTGVAMLLGVLGREGRRTGFQKLQDSASVVGAAVIVATAFR